jgi:hypothetical protein
MNKYNMNNRRKKFLIAVALLLCGLSLFGEKKPVLIKDKTPTHIEKNLVPLKLVHIIKSEFDKEHFLARPTELAVDSKGNLYVYDDLLNQVLIFDAKFKFIKAIGQTGEGPGDFSPSRNPKSIGIWEDNLLVWDHLRRRIIIFNPEGRCVSETKFPEYLRDVYPIILGDFSNRKFIAISTKTQSLGIYDKDYRHSGDLLKYEDYQTFFLRIPRMDDNKIIANEPETSNTWLQTLSGNRIVIYQSNSSTVYLFQDAKLKRRFDVRPALKIEYYEEAIQKIKKKLKKENFYKAMFNGFFVDQDNEKYIYFNGSSSMGKDEKLIFYRFDLEGKLVCMLYYYNANAVAFMAKRGGLFYAVDNYNEQIYIYKE